LPTENDWSSRLCRSGARQVSDLPQSGLGFSVFDRWIEVEDLRKGVGWVGKSKTCRAPETAEPQLQDPKT